MHTKKNRITFTIIALVAFASLVAGVFVAQHLNHKKAIDASLFHGTLLQTPRDIAPFSLVGVDNQVFDNKSLQGQWTMVFFGFTNCGYVCPTTMAELAKMQRLLEQKGIKPLPKVVLISLDPQRDTLEKLKNYTQSFHSTFFAARGDEDSVKKMTNELGIAYGKLTMVANSNNYDVQHSGAIMLFNPQGQLSAFFTTPHKAELLAEDYQLLIA